MLHTKFHENRPAGSGFRSQVAIVSEESTFSLFLQESFSYKIYLTVK